MNDTTERLLAVGSSGQRLVIELGAPYDGPPVFSERRYRHAEIHVEAGAFRGTVPAVADESQYREAATAFGRDGRCRFGGDRDTLVALERDGSAIDVEVTVTEDDPQVSLRFLIFE